METRQVTEVKVYRLVMNPMTGRIEDGYIVAISLDVEKLANWYESLKVEPYENIQDCSANPEVPVIKVWHKTFKKGSVLEWYNPIDSLQRLSLHHHGISNCWVNELEYAASPLLKII